MTKTTHFLFAHLINAPLLLLIVSQKDRRLSPVPGQTKDPAPARPRSDKHSIEHSGLSWSDSKRNAFVRPGQTPDPIPRHSRRDQTTQRSGVINRMLTSTVLIQPSAVHL